MTSYRDWVVELSNTTGTGSYSLAGAPVGTSYFTFRSRYSNAEDEVVYWVVNADRTKWEKNQLSTLTYGTPDTLSRNVVESTNGDAPVSWVGGDLPLRVYVVPDAAAQQGMIAGWLATTRHALLRFGFWFDRDNPSSGKHTWNLFDGSNDIALGVVDTAQHSFTAFYMPTGVTVPYIGATAPTGWVLAAGTIGDGTSSATARAHADTANLFALIWNSFADAQAPVSSGRGANAAADFAAHKRISLPDMRGRVPAGLDNPGGLGAANRLTAGGQAGIPSTTLGAAGGTQDYQLDISRIPSHAHAYSDPGHIHGVLGNYINRSAVGGGIGSFPFGVGQDVWENVAVGAAGIGITIANSGGDGAHSNTQPTIVMNYIIKL